MLVKVVLQCVAVQILQGEMVMAHTILDDWKILPRLMMLVTTIMYIRCLEWAMSQPDLSVSQAGLISVVTGAFTGAFGIWMGKESTTTVTSNKIVHKESYDK